MNRFLRLAPLLLLLGACRPPPPTPSAPAPPPPSPNRLTQVSLIDALMLGQYDGVLPIPDLLRLGDFGVGTLDHLDGELIVLDGHAYQVRADGTVHPVGPDRSTPFAAVTHFRPDGESPCPPVASLADLDAHLAAAHPYPNAFLAVRIDGDFAALTLRSVRRQEPPYHPLAEVAKTQSVWTLADRRGTLLGIRSPAWARGLNVPGFHWHFLAADRRSGGHVLDCRVRTATARHAVCRNWLIRLPDTPAFRQADLSQDLSDAVHRVESSRDPSPAPAAPAR